MSTESPEAVINKRQSLFITASSIISAASTFLVTWLAARFLPIQEGKDFLIFWSLTSLIFATLLGVQQESTRLVGTDFLTRTNNQNEFADNSSSRKISSSTYRPLTVAIAVGLTCAIIFVALSPLWLGNVLPTGARLSIVLIAITTVVYACHVYCIGAMAGKKSWTEYALLISTGGVFCLFLTGLAAFTKAGLLAFQLAFLATAFLWLVFVVASPQVRSAVKLRLPGKATTAYRGMMMAVGTAVAIATMSTGFPVFLEATSSTDNPNQTALLAAIILGISITRAPIMLPLQAFQGVAVSYFLNQHKRPIMALAKPVVALLCLGLIGSLAAYAVGPWLFDHIYTQNAGYLSGFFLAALTFAAALLAIITLSGTAALAIGAHRIYLLGWIVTVVVAFGCLLLPVDLITKTILALIIAPIVGFVVHITCMEILHKATRGKTTI